MIAALLLAACLAMPHFETDGPVCADPTLACACGECLVWDATPLAVRYEVERETMSNGARYAVGTVTGRWGETIEDWSLPTTWCAPMDVPFPRADTLYRYRVRACNEYGCGEWGDYVLYRAAPYTCYDAGREVACYVGDSVVSR